MKTKQKKQPGVISGIGVLMTILFKLVGYMKDIYGKLPLMDFIERVGADFYRLGTDEGQDILKQIAKLIVSGRTKIIEKAKNIFSVSVNYDLMLEGAARNGKYDWSSSDITSDHFPSKRRGTVEVDIEIIHFNRNISSENAIAELDKMGLRPAVAHELCSLGEKYPEMQRGFPIVALGSVWRSLIGHRRVLVLCGDDGGRGLFLDWFVGGWGAGFRFAAVRK